MNDVPRDGPAPAPSAHPPTAAESTTVLIERARGGDRDARDAIFARYLPRLQRWARDMDDTHDLVQETLLQTLKNIGRFEPRGGLALQAYLRQAVANRVRDELRRFARKPGRDPLDEGQPGHSPSPLDLAIGSEAAERYERALAALPEADRDILIARIEMGYSYQELADALGRPSADAARKASERALLRLAAEMKRAR
jgi:RNA polymerase sigma-70 factor (ECF subfamily)